MKAALRVTGMIALVAFVASRVDVAAAKASWRGMSATGVGVAGLAFCAAMAVRIRKWRRQAEAVGLRFLPRRAARSFLLGVLLGVVTPMRLGELTRLSGLALESDTRARDLARAAAALLIEKLVEVIVLGALASLGAWVIWPGTPIGPLVSAAVLALAVGVLAPVQPPRGLLARLPEGVRTRAVDPVLAARDGLSAAQRLELLAWTATAQGLNMLGGYQVYRAFGELDLVRFTFGMPLLTFSSAAPFTVSGIGLREAAAMQVFGTGGYDASAAAVAASVVFMGANVLPCVALLPFTWWRRERATS